MAYAISIILGYLLGTINPAALIGRIKKINMRKSGTGNLGATNTALLFGKKFGAAVMAFDIFKGALAVILAKVIFKEVALVAGILAGCAVVLGHMFPFYMKFKGGKGLAAYGGMILAFDPLIFLILLCLGLICMFVFNHGIALTMSAATFFPVLVALDNLGKPNMVFLTAASAAISLILIIRHKDNLVRSAKNEEITTRQFFKKVFGKKQAGENADQQQSENS
ncbi:MAG: glycerol-3-phosphate acyltransferase [Clostridia bacterium]|nr:glycerol-3-phosphate acyltransferase [Clostridia bacterium]